MSEPLNELEMHRKAYDMVQDAGFENPEELLATYKKLSEHEPLARIVDWRNEEVFDCDIVVNSKDYCTFALDDFKIDGNVLGKDNWDIVIRINTGALPKPTITRAEAERELGKKIVD